MKAENMRDNDKLDSVIILYRIFCYIQPCKLPLNLTVKHNELIFLSRSCLVARVLIYLIAWLSWKFWLIVYLWYFFLIINNYEEETRLSTTH